MQLGSYFVPRALLAVAAAVLLLVGAAGAWLVWGGKDENAAVAVSPSVAEPNAPVGRAQRAARTDAGISGRVLRDCPPRLKKTCPLRPQRGVRVTARFIAGTPPKGQKRETSAVSRSDGSYVLDLAPGPYAVYPGKSVAQSQVVVVYPHQFAQEDILLKP